VEGRCGACHDVRVDLEEAVTELYGQHPDAFMGARTALVAQVRSDGDPGLAKAVASVRKPTVAAWAVNQLVRRRPDDLATLLDLAARLQQASERMDGAALRDLGRERTALVDRLLRGTRGVASDAGGPLTGVTVEQVRETYVAALASPPAAEAVASGQLTRALSYAGFGDVDLTEALAAPAPARRPTLTVLRGERGSTAAAARGTDVDDETTPDHEEGDEEDKGEGEGDEGDAGEEDAGEEDAGPDPALVARLDAARRRTRETTTEAAAAGARLDEATGALTDLDSRITELEAALREARTERDGLLTARADATAADKVAQRTLRASFAELDAVRELVGDDD